MQLDIRTYNFLKACEAGYKALSVAEYSNSPEEMKLLAYKAFYGSLLDHRSLDIFHCQDCKFFVAGDEETKAICTHNRKTTAEEVCVCGLFEQIEI